MIFKKRRRLRLRTGLPQCKARSHKHHLGQEWCAGHFPAFIPKTQWSPNSPDLCPLDYSLWNELADAMKWNHATIKATLIDDMKRSVKTVEEVMFVKQSISFCADFKALSFDIK